MATGVAETPHAAGARRSESFPRYAVAVLIPLVSATGLVMIILSFFVAAFAVLGIVRAILGTRKEDDVRDSK